MPWLVHHPAYEVDIGPHVFPTRKYRLVRERLLAEGTITEADCVMATPATDADVALVHTSEYLRKVAEDSLSYAERMTLEVPFSAALHDAMWLCAGGTLLTCRLALQHAAAAHLGGGFHHAFPDHGEGFCLINDVAVAVRVLQRESAVGRALIIDLDVHHGNGTAAVFAGDDSVFTFSMHQQHNYPAWKPPSDLDIGLADGTGDAAYLDLLENNLRQIVSENRFDLALYLAGADPYEQDQLGGLALTREGLGQRDGLVFATLGEAGIPVAVTLAGGYAVNPEDTIEIHCATVKECKRHLESGC